MKSHTFSAIFAYGIGMFIAGDLIKASEGATWVALIVSGVSFLITFIFGFIEIAD